MPLTLGQRLGRYEIVGILGSGGMGQVYRGHDAQLNRDVAIKVLLPELGRDADRLARLSREAQLLASLNHTNIAAIYGLEEEDGNPAIVMELVEGPTLATRIAQGALPLADVLSIARQIIEALTAAHEQGIIHRDLKPANIKVKADGTVKVLDFGLAKAIDEEAAVSPTVSTHLTKPGLIMGTAAYMSPEQAAGRPVDARTDLWTFGVVLFEMLTGRPAFSGESASHVMAAVLTSEPDWSAVPAYTPPALRRVMRRCLDRDRRRRLAHAADARLDIEEAMMPGASEILAGAGAPAGRVRSLAPWLLGLAALTAFGVGTVLLRPRDAASPTSPVWMEVRLGGDAPMTAGGFGPSATLAPDGRSIAYVGERSASRRNLYIRRLDQLTATPLSGTEGAEGPFFSPDGQWLAFFADSKLKKVAVTGGAPVILADAASGRGGDWLGDEIIFQPSTSGPLMRVSSAGGTPTPFSTLADGEVTHRWPQVLPGGQQVIFTANAGRVRWDDGVIVAQTVADGARRVLHRGGYFGRYASSGHLLYVHNAQLFVVGFDVGQLSVVGTPVLALAQPLTTTGSGAAQFAITASGTALFEPRRPVPAVPMAWMTRAGATSPLRETPADWRSPQFSPDGSRLAIDVNDGRQLDVWVGDWARGDLASLTTDTADDFKPIWTPDGQRLTFSSNRTGVSNLYWRRWDGSREPERLTESPNLQVATSWHPNGRLLAFQENRPKTGYDLMLLELHGDNVNGWKPATPTVFLATVATETEPMFSPDGQWLAYVSNESGRDEVYVRAVRGSGGPWPVSVSGGTAPTWSRARPELLFRTPGHQVMSVTYTASGGIFRAGAPSLWAPGRIAARRGQRAMDLHPDGERLAVPPVGTEGEVALDHVTIVLNMFAELDRRLPPTRR